MAKKKTTDAVRILDKLTGDDRKLRELIRVAKVNAMAAQLILEAREAAGLTQRQLADLIGTKQPAIARLEDADYEGHTLSMLQRIADALGRRLVLRMEPKDEAA